MKVSALSTQVACGIACTALVLIAFLCSLIFRGGPPPIKTVEPKQAFEVDIIKKDAKLQARAGPATDGSNTLIIEGMDSGSPLAECVPRILIGDRIAAVNRKAGDVTELLRHLKAEKLSMLVVRPGGLGAVEQNVKVDPAALEVEAAPEGSSSLAVTGGSAL